MSDEGGVRIDAKFIGLLIFLASQLAAAIWWAGVKSAEVTQLQSDVTKLATHIDKQLDRMESKIDKLRN